MNTPDYLRACLSVGRLSLLAAMGGLFVASPAAADLVLKFDNDRPDASTVPAYITFGGGGPLDATATINGVLTDLELGASYPISELAGGVDVTYYKSGRVFVSLGEPLIGLTAETGWAPNFVAPGPQNPNFLTRFDKYEIVYQPGMNPGGAAGGANLSSTDFFGIPLKLTATGPSQPAKTLTWNESTATVLKNLGALANYSTITTSNPLGALVQGNNGVTVNTPNGPIPNVIRIVAPSSTNGAQTPFPSFSSYLNYIQTNKIAATIAGQNGQYPDGGPFQNYDFNAYISTETQTINGLHISPGDLVLTGSWTLGSKTQPMTILVRKANLNDFNIYGANPPFEFSGGAEANEQNIVQKVVADYFSALNFGFIGSTEPNPTTIPEWRGKPLGESPSWTWFGNKPNGGFSQPIPLGAAYAAAQPNNPYYNQYAAYLNNDLFGAVVTDSYGFPYTDRLASPLADLFTNTTLTMTILPDTIVSGSLAVPEPSTLAMIGLGFAGLGFVGYRSARKRRPESGAVPHAAAF